MSSQLNDVRSQLPDIQWYPRVQKEGGLHADSAMPEDNTKGLKITHAARSKSADKRCEDLCISAHIGTRTSDFPAYQNDWGHLSDSLVIPGSESTVLPYAGC